MNMAKVFNPAADVAPNKPPSGAQAYAAFAPSDDAFGSSVADTEGEVDAAAVNYHEETDTPEWFRRMCHDMISPDSETTLPGASLKLAEENLSGFRAVFAASAQLWLPDQTLTYTFVPPPLVVPLAYAENQRHKVRAIAPEWEQYGAFKFQEVPWGQPSMVRITFNIGKGSYSWVGNDNLRRPLDAETMNFGWVYGNNKTADPVERATILHEFGHALGMMHEHQSPARNASAFKNTEEVIQWYMKTQKWPREAVIDQVIRVYTDRELSNYSQVDEHSIMHYAMPKAITGLDHDIDYNYQLSDLDKAYMTINYPRSKPAEDKAVATQHLAWTLEKALDRVGIAQDEPETAKKILGYRIEDTDATTGVVQPARMRQAFSAWTVKAHALKNIDKIFQSGKHVQTEPQRNFWNKMKKEVSRPNFWKDVVVVLGPVIAGA